MIIPGFVPICQNPQLPTGCEITSLTMVLMYWGFDVDKEALAENYLEKGPIGTVDFRKAFVGDPHDENSFGCYAPVIEKTARTFLSDSGSSLQVQDLTGQPLESLFSYLDRHIPVIIWATKDCLPGRYVDSWYIDGRTITWFEPEHCMVLVGYDEAQVFVADPITGGIRSFTCSDYTASYDALFRQAVVILPDAAKESA